MSCEQLKTRRTMTAYNFKVVQRLGVWDHFVAADREPVQSAGNGRWQPYTELSSIQTPMALE